jgi:hypothetical protein
MEKDVRYFNFPIELLSDFLNDSSKVLNNICDYALYSHTLNLEYGDELECMKASQSFFKVTLSNIEKSLNNGKQLFDSIRPNSPKVGINFTIFWDYYKNDKSEFDKACLLAFLAIKSILNKKSYCKIDNRFLLARMDGKAKSCDFEALSPSIRKFATEYQTKKIKYQLTDSWNLKTYSRYTRGFYVSFKLNLNDLIYEAEKRRKSVKEKQSKLLQNEGVKNALMRLNQSRPYNDL